MRQRVEVGLPMRQNTPVAHGEDSTLSDMNLPRVAFSPNQISALVLPLVSDSEKLLWVKADEVNLQLDVAAQLDKTFDMFPYLTPKLTAALAERCSLHPDQVRVWFMLQRLRYGISWDYADISKVRKKIKASRGTGEPQKGRKKNNSLKSEDKEPDRKKARRVREDQSTNEGRAPVDNVRDNELLEREIKEEQLTQEERGRKGKGGKRKKQKRTTVLRKKRAEKDVVEGAEGVEITSDEVAMASAESKPCQSAGERKQKDGAVPECVVVPRKVEGERRASLTNPIGADADVGQPKEVRDVTKTVVADYYRRQRNKTHRQLGMMKSAFLSCQYPEGEDYDHLTDLSGVSRYMLVQWFSDMRYYIKKKKPHWMNQEQHRQALANIQYRQCLTALTRKVSDVKDEAKSV